MRHLILFSSLLFLSICATAQNSASTLPDDLGFYVGANVPMYKGQESDVVLGITMLSVYRSPLPTEPGPGIPRVG